MSWYSIVLLAIAYIVVGCFFSALYSFILCSDPPGSEMEETLDAMGKVIIGTFWPLAVPFAIFVYVVMILVEVFTHAIFELFKTRTYKKS